MGFMSYDSTLITSSFCSFMISVHLDFHSLYWLYFMKIYFPCSDKDTRIHQNANDWLAKLIGCKICERFACIWIPTGYNSLSGSIKIDLCLCLCFVDNFCRRLRSQCNYKIVYLMQYFKLLYFKWSRFNNWAFPMKYININMQALYFILCRGLLSF